VKILTIGNFTSGWDGSICDEEHIASALEELGHEVFRMQREEFEDVHYIGDSLPGPFDFTLVAQWDGFGRCHIMDKTIIGCLGYHRGGKTRQTDSYGPIVYWAFDYQADGQEWHERLVKGADLYLSKRIADSKYSNWQWLAQDFAPNFLAANPKSGYDIDVLFTGSYLDWATERNETLKAVDENFNLVIHSVNSWEGFRDVRPPIMDDGLPELYNRAKIILSIDHTLEAGYWSDRNAQIIACGRKPLFRYIPLSEARFGDRVTYFYNIDGCLDYIADNLDNPQDEARTDGLFVTDRVRDLLTIVRGIL